MTKLLIFDLDGTLSTLRDGWEYVLETLAGLMLGNSPQYAEFKRYIEISGGIASNYHLQKLQELQREAWYNPTNLQSLIDVYKSARESQLLNRKLMSQGLDHYQLQDKWGVPGLRGALSTLYSDGYSMEIVSTLSIEEIQDQILYLGIQDFFASLHSPGVKENFASTEEGLRIAYSVALGEIHAYMIGDSPCDVSLAGLINIPFIGIAYAYTAAARERKEKLLREAGAKTVLPDLSNLAQSIAEVGLSRTLKAGDTPP